MQIPRAALKQQDFLPAQRNITITVKSAKLSHKISPSARSDPPARLSVRRRHREIISQPQTSIDTRTTAPGGGRFLNGAVAGETYADFDQSLAPINGNSHGSAGGSFTAQGGESLGQLAQQLWGDSSLWYRLAQANGLTGETRLGAGQTIAIPSGIMRSSHSAATFNPYDPLAAMGDTSPTTPAPPVMSSGGGRRSGCGVIGQLLVMAISIAVSVALPGSGVFVNAMNGMIGSLAGQMFGVLTGIQQDINFNSIAMAGIAGGIGGALKGVDAFGMASKLARVGSDVVRGMAANALTQGVGLVTRMQKNFDFAGLAVAGVVAGVGRAVSDNIGGKATYEAGEMTKPASFNNQTIASTASGVAGAAARSLLTGTSFGDNLLAVLPDVIGTTLGRLASSKLTKLTMKAKGDGDKLDRAAKYAAADDFSPDELNKARKFVNIPKSSGDYDRVTKEVASLIKANVSSTEIEWAMKNLYSKVDGDRSSEGAESYGAMSEKTKEISSDHSGGYARRRPSAEEWGTIQDILGVDISAVTLQRGGSGSPIARIALRPDSDGNIHKAITIGETIYFHDSAFQWNSYVSNYESFKLLAHESFHVSQYREMGTIKVWGSITNDAPDWKWQSNGALQDVSEYSYYARISKFEKNGVPTSTAMGNPRNADDYIADKIDFRTQPLEAQAQIAGDYAGFIKFGVEPSYRFGVKITVPAPLTGVKSMFVPKTVKVSGERLTYLYGQSGRIK